MLIVKLTHTESKTHNYPDGRSVSSPIREKLNMKVLGAHLISSLFRKLYKFSHK